MRKTILLASAALSLLLVSSAFAGSYTYYKIKGGSASVDVSAAKKLDSEYGIAIDRVVGPLKLKRGGSVYHSSNSMTADFTSSSKIVVKYDTRGEDGKKAGVTTFTIKRLGLTVGKKRSFMIGHVSGSSTVPGVTVKTGEIRVFNIGGGKVKKSKSSKYAYTFASSEITFNSALTNLMNAAGTPMGNKHASAKIDLGGFSVKVK